jgi:peptide/nickel transport system permease protein
MARFLLRRVVSAFVLILLVVSLVFFVLQLAPGKPGALLSSSRLSPEQQAHLATAYGLDQPLWIQYGRWLRALLLEGDWGTSFSFRRPVLDLVWERLPATALLAFAATALHLVLAVSGGVLAAWRRGSGVDRALRGLSLVLYASPGFSLALLGILVFAYWLPILPAGHMRSSSTVALSPAGTVLDLARHLILPASVLALSSIGITLQLVRTTMLEALGRDYIRTARAKGATPRRVLWVHALRNSLAPILQTLGIALPSLLNGSLLIETIFSWPGVGRLTFQAILDNDYPLAMGAVSLSAVVVVLGSLVADLLHAWVDPRLRDV